jgi:hypothetical protein
VSIRFFSSPSAWCPERVITLSRYYVATRAPRELRATLPCGTGKLLKQLTCLCPHKSSHHATSLIQRPIEY